MRRKLRYPGNDCAVPREALSSPRQVFPYGKLQRCLNANVTSGGVYDIVNLFSGGALLQLSIFALGVMPYITASIIIQLLRVVIPRFQEELHDEGHQGQAKLTSTPATRPSLLLCLNANHHRSRWRAPAFCLATVPSSPGRRTASWWIIVTLWCRYHRHHVDG